MLLVLPIQGSLNRHEDDSRKPLETLITTQQARLPGDSDKVSGPPFAYFLPAWAYDGPAEPPPTPDAAVYAAEATPAPPAAPESIEGLICSYGWDCETALRIARCESGLQSVQNLSGGPYFGIFQLWSGHFREGEDWRDPATNIAVAWRVYQGSGWSPWECR